MKPPRGTHTHTVCGVLKMTCHPMIVERFPSVKDFISDCRLAKGKEESGGKVLGVRCPQDI